MTSYHTIYPVIWSRFNRLADKAENIAFEFEDMNPEAGETNPTPTTDGANHTILQKRPRPEPKRKDNAEYVPSPDHSDTDSEDERGAKKYKRGGEKEGRQM